MTERLQKILSQRGVCSRRAAETLISQGRVTCNGVAARVGDCADAEIDEIRVDGVLIPSPNEKMYIMLNKPRGYVTTLCDEKGRKTVAQLVKSGGVRLYPVGRLDMDSEGLLLMTNDGDLAFRLMHPSHEIKKTYYVWVRGFQEDSIARLSRRVLLDSIPIRQPEVRLLTRSKMSACISVTIHEGRNRQVRRMCALAGLQVTRLQRVREGCLFLGDLPLGGFRSLTREEVEMLKKETMGQFD